MYPLSCIYPIIKVEAFCFPLSS
uniref:Uncharacterized protein n=1 Tax=Rhizophora mucronata TaxID=61149 RepID=A0A2P2NNR7_RHIMU